MPPFLAQGMCSGMRDAHNIAWKLDLVLRGLAGEELLDSYQPEREPHVRFITEKAIELGRVQTLRDPEKARERDERLLARGARTGRRRSCATRRSPAASWPAASAPPTPASSSSRAGSAARAARGCSTTSSAPAPASSPAARRWRASTTSSAGAGPGSAAGWR